MEDLFKNHRLHRSNGSTLAMADSCVVTIAIQAQFKARFFLVGAVARLLSIGSPSLNT
jgi:hypothetical protein